MGEIKLRIDSILGGIAPAIHAAGKGQFLASQGIDPEVDVLKYPSGYIMPTGFTAFSGAALNAAPTWLLTSNHNTKVYAYCDNGRLVSYDNTLGSETNAGTPTSGAGNGAVILNDYLCLMTPTDVSVYGPLSGSPSITNTWWTTTASLTAFANSLNAATRNVYYPNHAAHLHSDGKAYICDYNGLRGRINKLGITSAGANDGSAYDVLALPTGFRPYDLETFGTDLAIVGSSAGTDTATKQGGAFLVLWDTFSPSFYRQIPIPGAMATAVLNVGGVLYIWAGSVDYGYSLFRYTGGFGVEQVWSTHEGSPPFAGAVDAVGDRVVWGAFTTSSGPYQGGACLFSKGYQNKRLGPADAIHNIGVVNTGQTLPVVSAVKYVQQAQNTKYPVIGWRTDTSATYGLSKYSASAVKAFCSFASEVFSINRPFAVRDIRLPLTAAVSVGGDPIISPYIYYDDATTYKALNSIGLGNYPGLSTVKYEALEIEQAATVDSNGGVSGFVANNNFMLYVQISSIAAQTGIALPIEITVETLDN